MKSGVRIQGQGKVKGVGLRAPATVPAAERVDATVALKGQTPVERLCELRLTASHAVRRPA